MSGWGSAPDAEYERRERDRQLASQYTPGNNWGHVELMRPGKAKRVNRFLLAMAAGAVLAATGIAWAADADAAPSGVQCRTDLWGFLGSQRRTICDGPLRADGSWLRERTIWWPERWVPVSCGRYSCGGGYWVDAGGSRETYPVTAATVLPDEPQHLAGAA